MSFFLCRRNFYSMTCKHTHTWRVKCKCAAVYWDRVGFICSKSWINAAVYTFTLWLVEHCAVGTCKLRPTGHSAWSMFNHAEYTACRNQKAKNHTSQILSSNRSRIRLFAAYRAAFNWQIWITDELVHVMIILRRPGLTYSFNWQHMFGALLPLNSVPLLASRRKWY